MLSWTLVSSQIVGKCQMLIYVKSCRYVGMPVYITSQYEANSFTIVCVVLALDRLNYCSKEQCPTAQHPLLNVYPNGCIEEQAVEFPAICHLVDQEFT